MFHWNIQKYIEEKQLFTLHDKVLVALSGGADSVALLRVLLVLGYHCEAAHCNFHLRGEESDRDERFVNELCKGLGVTLHVTHFDTVAYASRHHVSIEMAAREMRYDWFEQLRKERGMAVIAVAHHRDDSVETFLLNLIRGAGINGLKGISPHNGCIVRPLLEVSRQDILDYLRCLRQGYVTDSTNLQDEYMRNKIRLNILPMLRELNPSVSESIAETSRRLTDVSLIYNKEIDLELAQRIVRKVVKSESKAVTVDDIINVVCKHFSLDTATIHTKSRKREVVQARQIAMFLAKSYTDFSTAKIGALIGHKDHATVLHACKTIKELREVDKTFRAEIDDIQASLKKQG